MLAKIKLKVNLVCPFRMYELSLREVIIGVEVLIQLEPKLSQN